MSRASCRIVGPTGADIRTSRAKGPVGNLGETAAGLVVGVDAGVVAASQGRWTWLLETPRKRSFGATAVQGINRSCRSPPAAPVSPPWWGGAFSLLVHPDSQVVSADIGQSRGQRHGRDHLELVIVSSRQHPAPELVQAKCELGHNQHDIVRQIPFDAQAHGLDPDLLRCQLDFELFSEAAYQASLDPFTPVYILTLHLLLEGGGPGAGRVVKRRFPFSFDKMIVGKKDQSVNRGDRGNLPGFLEAGVGLRNSLDMVGKIGLVPVLPIAPTRLEMVGDIPQMQIDEISLLLSPLFSATRNSLRASARQLSLLRQPNRIEIWRSPAADRDPLEKIGAPRQLDMQPAR